MAKRVFVALLLILAWPLSAYAAKQVTLAWDPSPDQDVAGYELYFRQQGQQYTYQKPAKSVDKTQTTATVTIPADGYFVARAFDASGNRSADSNEVDTIKPASPKVRVSVVVDVQ